MLGASIDNNIVCIAEKEIFAVASIADALQERLGAGLPGGNGRQVQRAGEGGAGAGQDGVHPNKDCVGKNAAVIARPDRRPHGHELRLLVAEVDERHPFVQLEMLMPVLPLVRVPDATEAHRDGQAGRARLRAHRGDVLANIDNLHAMARTINTSIFVKNASNLAGLGYGGEGYTSFTIASPTGEGLTTVAQLHPRAALHPQGILPHCLTTANRPMGPALALIELSSIARGHRVADAMLKRAPVRLMRADADQPRQVPGAGRG